MFFLIKNIECLDIHFCCQRVIFEKKNITRIQFFLKNIPFGVLFLIKKIKYKTGIEIRLVLVTLETVNEQYIESKFK